MLATLLRLVGIDLQRQLAHLRAQAEDFKNRTTLEVQHKVADTSITIGIAFVGLFFVLLTVVVALVALYLWVDMQRGPFAALAAVGLATGIMAALTFAIVAARSPRPLPKRPIASPVRPAPAALANYPSAVSGASLLEGVTSKLADRTAAAAHEALDSAAEMVRKSPREAIIGTLAVAAVIGVVIGRRR
jgi:hypothetical protein